MSVKQTPRKTPQQHIGDVGPKAPATKTTQAAPTAQASTVKSTQQAAVRADKFEAPKSVGQRAEPPQVSHASIKFDGNWDEVVSGDLKQGGKLTMEYSPDRVQRRHTHNGFPAWGVNAYITFHPTGDTIEKPAIEFDSIMGRPTNNARSAKLEVDIPKDATHVEVWFKNWTGADRPGESWDSDYSRNYHFPVTP